MRRAILLASPIFMTGAIIVTALIGGADLAWLDALRRTHFPPERNLVPAHLTIFHHLPPSAVRELGQRLDRATRNDYAPGAQIVGPSLLGHGVALDVRSDALAAIRTELADAFAGLLMPQDAAAWRPHVTIQNKVEPATARTLHADLLTQEDWPRPLEITGLGAWHYLGGPWAPIARYPFNRSGRRRRS